jgi:hypothetical protein
VRARISSYGPLDERPVRWEANVVETRQPRYPGRSSRQVRTIECKGNGSSARRAGSSAASRQRRNTVSRAAVAADAPAPAPALLAAPVGAPGAANGCCASAAALGVRGALRVIARAGLRSAYEAAAPIWMCAPPRTTALPAAAAASGSDIRAGARCAWVAGAERCARGSGGARGESTERNSSVDTAARALESGTFIAGRARTSDSNWAIRGSRSGISATDAPASLRRAVGGNVAAPRTALFSRKRALGRRAATGTAGRRSASRFAAASRRAPSLHAGRSAGSELEFAADSPLPVARVALACASPSRPRAADPAEPAEGGGPVAADDNRPSGAGRERAASGAAAPPPATLVGRMGAGRVGLKTPARRSGARTPPRLSAIASCTAARELLAGLEARAGSGRSSISTSAAAPSTVSVRPREQRPPVVSPEKTHMISSVNLPTRWWVDSRSPDSSAGV